MSLSRRLVVVLSVLLALVFACGTADAMHWYTYVERRENPEHWPFLAAATGCPTTVGRQASTTVNEAHLCMGDCRTRKTALA